MKGTRVNDWKRHSSNNTIYHTNPINNTLYNAYDTGTDTWDSGSEGNYWSDYNCTDSDGDGSGEDPHPIPGGGSTDRFPLPSAPLTQTCIHAARHAAVRRSRAATTRSPPQTPRSRS